MPALIELGKHILVIAHTGDALHGFRADVIAALRPFHDYVDNEINIIAITRTGILNVVYILNVVHVKRNKVARRGDDVINPYLQFTQSSRYGYAPHHFVDRNVRQRKPREQAIGIGRVGLLLFRRKKAERIVLVLNARSAHHNLVKRHRIFHILAVIVLSFCVLCRYATRHNDG